MGKNRCKKIPVLKYQTLKTMSKIDQIKKAIEQATNHQSKLSGEVLNVPSFTSVKIRHLLNNLGAISKNYLECGCHLGGHFCSTVYGNSLHSATAFDNFSEFSNGDETRKECWKNMHEFSPAGTVCQLIEEDCFSLEAHLALSVNYDFLNYDANHGEFFQQKAVAHFLPNLTKEFIFVVDDWSFEGVERGTRNGILFSGLETLFEQILITPSGQPHNDHFHNNFAVFLLKQK